MTALKSIIWLSLLLSAAYFGYVGEYAHGCYNLLLARLMEDVQVSVE